MLQITVFVIEESQTALRQVVVNEIFIEKSLLKLSLKN